MIDADLAPGLPHTAASIDTKELNNMKRLLVFAAIAASLSAEDVSFKTVHLVTTDGKKEFERPASLVLSDSKEVLVRGKDATLATVPYAGLTHVEYDFAKHHRIATGALVMVASLGAGAVVMLTKSTKHWLEFQYKQDGQDRALLLRLDKKDYKDVLSAVEARTGMMIARSKQSTDKDKEEKVKAAAGNR